MNATTTSPACIAAELMPAYTHTILMLERLHRRLMDVVTDALDRAKISDVNAIQAIMLYNIADQELTKGILSRFDAQLKLHGFRGEPRTQAFSIA